MQIKVYWDEFVIFLREKKQWGEKNRKENTVPVT